MSYNYTSTNPRAAHNPICSIVWNKPAHHMLGLTAKLGAEFELSKARRTRRAAAFLEINRLRADLRDARLTLAAAELAILAFADAA